MNFYIRFQDRHSCPLSKKAIFLDRDGVINKDKKYVHKVEQVEFIPGIFELCSKAKKNNYLLIVITNQSGIGRGYYTELEFINLMAWMNEKFIEKTCGLNGVYYCPYFESSTDQRYKSCSSFRKPNPGMIIKAKEDFGLDLSCCKLIGDQISDMEAGFAAGVGVCYLLNSGDANNNFDPRYRIIKDFDSLVL